ncbi:MAG: pyridoxal-phosphate dependent enzyme [Candidatus Peregrinibacteria bacterium]|nr:pyridoxal-phosphate dependent enzyme [Candidatus Peregrinibacteria bacterium]MDZ4244300.1 pyridoxal-phosphate dependent enzyme [Candidatus Gracilibacteria bacterium]
MARTEFQLRLTEKEHEAKVTDSDIKRLDRGVIYERLEAIIGKTRLHIISHDDKEFSGDLLVKDETDNPTESHYDRCYIKLLRALEEGGTIKPGDTLLETSSGSAGVSFAWLAKKLGYKPIVFMPSFVPQPRIHEAERNAEVHLSDDRERYMTACAEKMVGYLRDMRNRHTQVGRGIWIVNHSMNPITLDAFEDIAREVMGEYPAQIESFVGGIGNGATLLSVGKYLRENQGTRVVGFEPIEACPAYRLTQDPNFVSTADLIEPPRRYTEDMKDMRPNDSFTPHDYPGLGGSGLIDFPFIKEALGQHVSTLLFAPKKSDIAKLRHSYPPPDTAYGNSTMAAQLLARYYLRRDEPQFKGPILTLAYDKADRY